MLWSSDLVRRLPRFAPVLALTVLLGGCFQPLYGDRTVTGGAQMSEKLSLVDVQQIDAPNGRPEARIGVELRNALIFDLTGGQGTSNPAYRLKINLSTTRQQVIVDIFTNRPDIENFGIDATYSLIDNNTGKVVMTGHTFPRVSYDSPGQHQRFPRA